MNTKTKGYSTILTIMVLSLLCYEIKLITARSTNSMHDGAHQQNSLTKMSSSKQRRGWNPTQPLTRVSQNDEDELLDEEDLDEDQDKEDNVIPPVDGSSEENSKLSPGTQIKHWLDLEGVPPSRVPVKLHSDLTLECQAVGSPPPMVYWMKNGKPIDNALTYNSEEQYLNHIHGSASGQSGQSINSLFGSENKGFRLGKMTSKLPLRCIRPEDEAQYSCVADNEGRQVMASTLLVIEEDDPSGELRPECELRLSNFMFHKKGKRGSPAYIISYETLHMERIGNDIVLPCRGAGRPRPKIRWTDNEGQEIVSGKKFYVSSNGNLMIKNLSWNEMGEYSCIVENSFGSDMGSTFLYPLLEEKKR